MPESLEQLDLLLLTVAKPRKVHPDGIQFQGLRYLDPVLAAYVGERHHPLRPARPGRDPGLPPGPVPRAGRSARPGGPTISLKEITAARSARRRELEGRSASAPASSTG